MGLRFAARPLTPVLLACLFVVVATSTSPDASAAQRIAPQRATSMQKSFSPPQARVPQIDIGDAHALASLAQIEIAQLRANISLDSWMKSGGTRDRWQLSPNVPDFACREFSRTAALPSGRQVILTVTFYPPKAPTPALFPTGSAQDLIHRDCTLAMIRAQTPAQQDGDAFAQALQQQLAEPYGRSIGMKGTGFFGSGSWKDAARWKNASEIVSAYNPTPISNVPVPDSESVFIFARAPYVSELEEKSCCSMREYQYRSIEYSQFHRAIALAKIDPAFSSGVVNLYEALFAASASQDRAGFQNRKPLETVTPVLRDWLAVARTLPPARGAASYYVADRLLAAAIDLGQIFGWDSLCNPEEPGSRPALEEIGAVFESDPLSSCYDYSNNWLKNARDLDPDGAVGQMAVLVSIARGGGRLRKEEGIQDVFTNVIAEGKWLLDKGPDPSTAAQVHFIMGDAYADIVALAGGAEPDYGEPTKYQGEADSARKKALEHYRAGLVVDRQSENAKDAWLQAWRLSAGLLPTTRYVYVGD